MPELEVQPSGEREDREVLEGELVGEGSSYRGRPSATVGLEPNAVRAMALAIASWIILPIGGGIAAVFFAARSKRRIRHSDGNLVGFGLASAAQKIGAVNAVLGIAVVWVLVNLFQWIF